MLNHDFYKFLESKGYYFERRVIENFLLSIEVNPFVILFGDYSISKTKLPQLFAQYLVLNNGGYFPIKVSTLKRSFTSNRKNDKRLGWSIYKEYLQDVLPINEINGNYEIEIGGITTQADFSLLIQIYYDYNNCDFRNHFKELYKKEILLKEMDKKLKRKHEKQMVDLGVSYESLINLISEDYVSKDEIVIYPSLTEAVIKGEEKSLPMDIFDYIPLKKKSSSYITTGDLFSDAHFEMKLRMRNYGTDEIKNYLKILEKRGEKTFELKIKGFNHNFEDIEPYYSNLKNLISRGENSILSMNRNYEIVPIGTNWADSSHIIGYFNAILNEYRATPAFELIKHAQEDPNKPYFLILDEMNLSPIEIYFSDFLSAIESMEGIPLYGMEEILKIPSNLFIIGIITGEEMKYLTSPKVLDKVNLIKLEELIVKDYDFDKSEKDIDCSYSYLLNSKFFKLNSSDLKEILENISHENNNLWDVLVGEITIFQEILEDTEFHFGVRVVNDILRFMVASWMYENSPKEWSNWKRYFDAQIEQKILSKIYLTEKSLNNVLNALFSICVDDSEDIDVNNYTIVENKCKYYNSALKIQKLFMI